MSWDKIEMRPPAFVFAVAIAAITASIAMIIWSLPKIDRFTLFGIVVIPSAILFAFLLGVDGLQRRYVFLKDKIKVRYLFFWKEYGIHGDIEISSSKSGQVIIKDSQDQKPLLRIPCEYNREGLLEQQLRDHFTIGDKSIGDRSDTSGTS